MNALGERIRSLREERNLEVPDFARLVGVTPSAVWAWEKPDGASKPKPDKIKRIADIFNVPPEKILLDPVRPKNRNDAVAEAKRTVAQALGIDPDKIRINIEY